MKRQRNTRYAHPSFYKLFLPAPFVTDELGDDTIQQEGAVLATQNKQA